MLLVQLESLEVMERNSHSHPPKEPGSTAIGRVLGGRKKSYP